MCGRFTLRAPASAVAEQFSLLEVEPFPPRFNIAPSQAVAAVRNRLAAGPVQRELARMRWGLIPPWAKDPGIGNRMINARSESVLEKPAYRSAARQRRCLIVADGFYEWQKLGRTRQPFFVCMRDGRPFAFAGLWELWKAPDDSRVESCVLLTTAANSVVLPIHQRMPVILRPDDYGRWLEPTVLSGPEQFAAILRPYASEEMLAYPVDSYVNSPSHEGPKCVEPLPE